jgi:flagellar hook assembly protein FlgD
VLGSGARPSEVVYRFELARASRVEVTVHDLKGTRLAVLARGAFEAGPQAVHWDGSDGKGAALPAGVYLIARRFIAPE